MRPDNSSPTPQDLTRLIRGIPYIPNADAAEYLRGAIRRRSASLHAFTPDAADPEQLIAEIDIERVLYLLGTAQPALEIIAACIVELGTTTRAIEAEIRRIDIRPVGTQPTHAHLGIDIAFIVAFRALTREQRWALHSLVIWSPPPATIAREYALVVATGSGRLAGVLVNPDDLARIIALGLVLPVTEGIKGTLESRERIRIDPYVRFIAAQGLAEWPIPDADASVTAETVLASILVHWAVSFAEIIAGPDMLAPEDALPLEEDEDASAEDLSEERLITPDPDLAALTEEEAWDALLPEMDHVLLAAQLAREVGAAEYVYRLCQLLPPRLRGRDAPESRAFRRTLLEQGLICARQRKSARETLLLATQLTDVALDDQDMPRAAAFGREALDAAVAVKDLRAVAFAARRQAAIAIRLGDLDGAVTSARQAVATARAAGDRAGLMESIAVLEAATQLRANQS